jgi:hypothetical protein
MLSTGSFSLREAATSGSSILSSGACGSAIGVCASASMMPTRSSSFCGYCRAVGATIAVGASPGSLIPVALLPQGRLPSRGPPSFQAADVPATAKGLIQRRPQSIFGRFHGRPLPGRLVQP